MIGEIRMTYDAIVIGGERWRVDRDLRESFSAWAEGGRVLTASLRKNAHRRVSQADAVLASGVVVKESRPAGPWRRLRAFLGRGLRREWENAQTLHFMGGLSPRPVAFGRDGAGAQVLVTERVKGEALDDFGWRAFRVLPEGGRRRLLARLGEFLRLLEERLVRAGDLHAGNVLIETATERLYLVDLAAVRIGRPLSRARKEAQVASLLASMGFLSPRDRLRAAKAYADAARLPAGRPRRAFYRAVDARIWALWHRHWRSRTKRCLGTNGGFVRRWGPARSVFRRREFEEAWIDEAIAEFNKALERGRGSAVRSQESGADHPFLPPPSPLAPVVMKNAPESQVVRGLTGPWPGRICVKRLVPRDAAMAVGAVGRRARGVREWIAANGLAARGVGTARPLALVTEGWGPFRPRAWLVLEDLAARPEGARELDRQVCALGWTALPRAARGAWIRSLADEAARLHAMGVRIGDAKSCNLFAVGGDPATVRWAWVDLSSARLGTGRPGIPERIAFLVQLNLSIPAFVTTRERVRFFRRYARGLPRAARRGLLRGTARLSRPQRILYVGPEGDVEEPWPGR